MSSLLDTTRNFSLYTIPAAWLVTLLPHVYAISIYSQKFDNTKPRSLIKKIDDDQSIDQATKDSIVRAEAAHQNGLENIGLFAAAVVAANLARLDKGFLNALSGGYVASRVLYNLVYINNSSVALANVRSGLFWGGIGIVWTLFIAAGNRLRSAW